MTLYEYAIACDPYFWKWEDGCSVVEITHGNTIAYTALLKEIVVHLQEQGLPPFGSLLLVMAALGNAADSSIQQIKDSVAETIKNRNPISNNNEILFAEAYEFLLVLTELPESYKSGNRRLALLQTIFSKCHNMVSAQKSKAILKQLATDDIDTNALSKSYPFHNGIFERDFRTIALLHRSFPTAQSIISKMAEMPETSIDVEELDSELIEEVRQKDFVDELMENPKTFHVGSLIKPLWAGFKIPINTATPSQQQFGGISDLTNKGDFDKLLISEFAHDDLTFLSRLANNEALYLHREIPPAIDDRRRVLLADVSLLNWGTPKLLAYASCIAIAKHPKAASQPLAFAVGQTYESLNFDNIDQIVDGLQITSSSLHPASGIDSFLKENTFDGTPEIFLVLAAESYRQQSVQRVMSEYASAFRYLITVEATGHIAFYKYQFGVKKLIQEVSLNLNKLWEKGVKGEQKKSRQIQSEADECDYPVLFATPQNIKAVLKANDQFFCIADKKLFMRQESGKHQANKGFVVLKDKLHSATNFAMGYTLSKELLFLYFNSQHKQLTIVNLATKQEDTCTFKAWQAEANGFFFHDDAFYHLNTTGHFKIRFSDGQIKTETVVENTAALRQTGLHKEEQLRKLKHTQSKKAILKNVTAVFINNTDNLVFNQHELRYQDSGTIDLQNSGFTQRSIEANYLKNGELFEFPDKSTVTVNPSGMLLLQSSNSDIPVIYIPSVLGASLGIATDEHFSGNDYYSRAPFAGNNSARSVVLESPGDNKLEVVKILREEAHINLKEGKEMVNKGTPTLFIQGIKKHKAIAILNRLTTAGAEARITSASNVLVEREIRTIGTKDFYNRYIEAFIKHIQKSCS